MSIGIRREIIKALEMNLLKVSLLLPLDGALSIAFKAGLAVLDRSDSDEAIHLPSRFIISGKNHVFL
jgi:hypothetical protein